MLARNSDLYLEMRASCSAFSSSATLACSTSLFFCSTSAFWPASSWAFSSSSSVGLLQLVLLLPEQLLRLLQRAGLLLQPLVGLGQRLLLRLEALGERLRLLEQLLGPHVGRDRVEHDADALGQLLQEGEPDLVELVEGGELEHRLDLALEQHRQHHDAPGRRLAQAGADLDVVAAAPG